MPSPRVEPCCDLLSLSDHATGLRFSDAVQWWYEGKLCFQSIGLECYSLAGESLCKEVGFAGDLYFASHLFASEENPDVQFIDRFPRRLTGNTDEWPSERP